MKVFINPGHSKNCTPDPGCCYNDIKEAQICYEIGCFLADELLKRNIPCTVYQQQGDGLTSNQQLNTVAKKANTSGADLFISIHMNGAANSVAQGTEAWYQKGSSNGKKFAQYIVSNMAEPFTSITLQNRGTKEADGTLAVLRDTSMPAALAEICFISNEKEANFVKINRKNVAERLANAICQYYDVDTSVKSDYQQTFKMVHVEDDKYDLYVDNEMILAANKFSTCVEYLEKHYGV